MRIRWLLVLILVLVLVIPTLSLFQSPVPVSYHTGDASGSSVIIIAKEDYVYARALITIQPDGLNQSVSVTFPNGTSTTIEGLRTESIVLPNTIYYTFVDVGTSGEGYSVYGNHPLDVTFLSGQNATNFLTYNSSLVPAKGIHVFYLVIDGSAMVSVRVLGVSL